MSEIKEQLPKEIEVVGAKANNLKDVSVSIPLHKMTVITGVSGSGKSSLAMDTIYAEGNRRYLNALSAYSRRRIEQKTQAEFESIKHLPSTIALTQRPEVPSIRTTVGTLTEIFNIIRLMFSRLGSHVCPNGHRMEPTLLVSKAMNFPETNPLAGIVDCPFCGMKFKAPGAINFSFNADGACLQCGGSGEERVIEISKIIPDENLTLREGAVLSWKLPGRTQMPLLAQELGVRIDIPYNALSIDEKNIVLYGPSVKKKVVIPANGKIFNLDFNYENAFLAVENSIKNTTNETGMLRLNRFYSTVKCSACNGSRFNQAALTTLLSSKNIVEVSAMDLQELSDFSAKILDETIPEMKQLAKKLIMELKELIEPLLKLGIDYLTLDRSGHTLSTGELQRIQLARTIRNEITGILYVLDEPSVGLHQENIDGLLKIVDKLISQGNTVLIVEHELSMIRKADYIIEIGPKAGDLGGELIASGSLNDVIKNEQSIIAKYLNGKINLRQYTHECNLKDEDQFSINVHNKHNVKKVKATFYKNALNVVTGLSGSGKTTVVLDSLIPALHGQNTSDTLEGNYQFDKIVEIDATPIGKNIRSTVATYTNMMDELRKIYASLPQSKNQKYTISNFSYNNKEGACPYCEGMGRIKMDVQYLPDMTEVCPNCQGQRFNEKILSIKWKGYTIADVMNLSINEAITIFNEHKNMKETLNILNDIGLGYLKIGEQTPSLSGGEAQRLKLSLHLKKQSKNTLFVFDEPSIGLHPDDVQTLLKVMRRLIFKGATIIVIEHDLDIMINADHLIDMGPRGGKYGGQVIYSGSIKGLIADKKSITAKHLRNYINSMNLDIQYIL